MPPDQQPQSSEWVFLLIAVSMFQRSSHSFLLVTSWGPGLGSISHLGWSQDPPPTACLPPVLSHGGLAFPCDSGGGRPQTTRPPEHHAGGALNMPHVGYSLNCQQQQGHGADQTWPSERTWCDGQTERSVGFGSQCSPGRHGGTHLVPLVLSVSRMFPTAARSAVEGRHRVLHPLCLGWPPVQSGAQEWVG